MAVCYWVLSNINIKKNIKNILTVLYNLVCSSKHVLWMSIKNICFIWNNRQVVLCSKRSPEWQYQFLACLCTWQHVCFTMGIDTLSHQYTPHGFSERLIFWKLRIKINNCEFILEIQVLIYRDKISINIDQIIFHCNPIIKCCQLWCFIYYFLFANNILKTWRELLMTLNIINFLSFQVYIDIKSYQRMRTDKNDS